MTVTPPSGFLSAVPGLFFHHVGIACRAFAAEEEVFSALGYTRESEEFMDPIQGIFGVFLIGEGPRLELLRETAEGQRLTPWLRKGIKLYHFGYEVDDMDRAIAQLRAFGAGLVVAPVPAVAFGGRKIAFFMLPNRLLIELISRG